MQSLKEELSILRTNYRLLSEKLRTQAMKGVEEYIEEIAIMKRKYSKAKGRADTLEQEVERLKQACEQKASELERRNGEKSRPRARNSESHASAFVGSRQCDHNLLQMLVTQGRAIEDNLLQDYVSFK